MNLIANIYRKIVAQPNKCQIDGKTVYQEAPCKSGSIAVKLSVNDNAASDQNSNMQQKKLDSELTSLQTSKRLRDIDYEIHNLENDIQTYQKSINSEITALKNSKSFATNNLAGATWEVSVSTEMTAITAKYQSEIKVAQDGITFLRQEKASIKQGIKELKAPKSKDQ